MKRAILAVIILFVLTSVAATHAARDPGPCIGACAAEQGICIANCQGNVQCIGQCAAAHGRCVARCN